MTATQTVMGQAMVTTADVLVIGGGIAGIGAAARLSPSAQVIVLERETAIGTHSTGRSAATFIHNYGNATLRVLNAASLPVFKAHEELSKNPLLSPRGELAIVDEEGLDTLKTFVQDGTGLEILTPDEAVAYMPILRKEQIAAAALEADACDIDVDALLQGYVALLRRAGGRIETGVTITGLSRANSVWRIETSGGGYEAPVIINAAGAWADEFARLAGVREVGLVPKRRSAAILPAPVAEHFDHWPVVAPLDESWYAKPQSGKLLVSPADEDSVPPMDAWPDDMVLAEGLDRFERATTVTVTHVERSWAGLRSFVSDKTPVVGFAEDADGFFWLAGQGGYGIQTSPALAQLSADLILGRAPSISAQTIAALSPSREGIGPEAAIK